MERDPGTRGLEGGQGVSAEGGRSSGQLLRPVLLNSLSCSPAESAQHQGLKGK